MATESRFKAYIFPVLLIIISAIVGYVVTVIPKGNNCNAKLELDNIYISDNDQPCKEFGYWAVDTAGLNRLNKEKQMYQYSLKFDQQYVKESSENGEDYSGSVVKYPEFPPKLNELGDYAYKLKWMPRYPLLLSKGPRYSGMEPLLKLPDSLSSDIILPESSIDQQLIDSLSETNISFKSLDQELQWIIARYNKNVYRSLCRYIGHKAGVPTLKITLRNEGDKDATIYGFRYQNMYSTGGEAGAGGLPYNMETMNEQKVLKIDYSGNGNNLTFNTPTIVPPGSPVMLEVALNMQNASHGDGPATLTYALFLEYGNGDEKQELYVGTFIQDDTIWALANYL